MLRMYDGADRLFVVACLLAGTPATRRQLWFGCGCLLWAGVAGGHVWLAPPAALCSLFGVLDLWAPAADEDEED
jgi:hypothetical protein